MACSSWAPGLRVYGSLICESPPSQILFEKVDICPNRPTPAGLVPPLTPNPLLALQTPYTLNCPKLQTPHYICPNRPTPAGLVLPQIPKPSGAVTLPSIGVPHYNGVPHPIIFPYQTPTPETLKMPHGRWPRTAPNSQPFRDYGSRAWVSGRGSMVDAVCGVHLGNRVRLERLGLSCIL